MSDSIKRKNQYKIGVIGDNNSVMGFRAVGFSVHAASSAEEAESTLNRIAREDYAVIFITEDLIEALSETVAKYRSAPVPAIISIPGKSGSTGFGIKQIKKAVERAVGADILFK